MRRLWTLFLILLSFAGGLAFAAALPVIKDRIEYLVARQRGSVGIAVSGWAVRADPQGWAEVDVQNRSARPAVVSVVPYRPRDSIVVQAEKVVLAPWERRTVRFRVVSSPVDRPQVLVRLSPVPEPVRVTGRPGQVAVRATVGFGLSVPVTVWLR